MGNFRFRGDIPGSKSVFNRALIVQSYFPVLDLRGFSECDDVRHMREGLKDIRDRSRIDCGEGGTTFRFMALRASRHRGVHILEAATRLLERPQKGLLDLLNQLGVQTHIKRNELYVISEGWKRPRGPIFVDTSESSQYASALVLNAWLLDFDLEFELVGDRVSESYFDLTMKMLRYLGMRYQKTPKGYLIPAGQRIEKLQYDIEADLSSGFTMAAAGALAGESVITNFPLQSQQPDKVFVDILKRMGAEVELSENTLRVVKPTILKSVDCDLYQSPDLFPVLAVLCSWAEGTSKLYNAPHLVKKESNRIQRVSDLLSLVGVRHEILPDGMIIHGDPQQKLVKKVSFNPDKDHRMVMAASLMKLKGHGITIEEPQAINKSFPEFWEMIGLQP
ncbi:3-phosphoshikimate 1-carboxyvinyltransferase [Bdellovibrio svalbardensis]|uniref:3-phosphoshikimate 1-carboxyvinyltransferase n=1 Tax=Bdellovibrio svalbardensis TaxID=2972972 RepID=A0ABT6DEL7_9BACT|nr:3-phosphoshikimate 1-carboxyvinyltransferase [Bdellovibrio svalbardensis]MDG0815272.1 3-phosphoshikimate 1-carboxyvinyltransferase [Bdellovibrio svalbardensis]